jgi:hypothetical protein
MCSNFKKTFMITTLIISLTAARAQKIDFGFKAGVYFPGFLLANNIAPNPIIKVEGLFNLSYGANGIVKLKSDTNWEVWFEPGFAKKGGLIKYIYHDERISIPVESYCGVEYSDIELPVMLNIHLKNDFSYCVGLGVGYTLSSEHNLPGTINSPGRNLLPDLDKKFNSSIIAGLNYDLNEIYALSLRYTFGLTKVTAKDLIAETSYNIAYIPILTSIYNNSLQLSFIYNINL